MTSWAAAQAPRTQIRLGYRQILPEGNFISKEKPATVVSAYYEMSSKYKKQDYLKWIRQFLEKIPCYLVFFTEEHLVPFIKECRRNFEDKTVIITLSRDNWEANKRYQQSIWDNLSTKDPEKDIVTSSELYKVWYEKSEFVLRAIELNPFGHSDFVWTDAGIFRDPRLVKLAMGFPRAGRIPTNRIMLLNVWAFVRNDDVIREVNGEFFPGGGEDRPRIGGGIIAASKELWLEFSRLYKSTIERYRKADIFWGKDQTIFKTLVLENKTKFSLIELKPTAPEMWFYSVLYLGCSEKIFEILRSEKTNQRKRSYDELLQLDK